MAHLQYFRSIARTRKHGLVLGFLKYCILFHQTAIAGITNPQGKYAEAGPLYERAQAISETAHGPEHPYVATVLNNRALLLENGVRVLGFCTFGVVGN